jgi:valyl-tRNA synthetase
MAQLTIRPHSARKEIAQGADFIEEEIDTLNLVPDELRGLDRFEARKKVVAQITEEGLAVMVSAPVDNGDEGVGI